MRYRPRLAILAVFPLLAGCYTVPSSTDFALEINKDYNQVADCAWQTFRTREAWVKSDMPSMKKVEFAFTNGTSTAARIDIVSAGPGRTRVLSYSPAAVWGKDYWPKRNRPPFEACAAS